MFKLKLPDSKWFIFGLLALVVLAVFGRAVWFDYVQLDEGILLVNNKFFISDISNFFEVFKHDINYPSAAAPYYRPIFILSLMLNSQISTAPFAYHTGNVLLHIFAVVLFFFLLREFGVEKRSAFVFSALFGIHPAVTPVAAWVPGRIEAILTIFTLLSFIAFMRFLKTNGWHYLAVFFFSFAAALFTKEVVIALLPVLLFYYLTHRNEKGSEMSITLSSGLVAILIGWFYARKNIIGSQINDLTLPQMFSVLWGNLSGFILYLGKAVLPFKLSVFPVLENSSLALGFLALAILAGLWILCKIKPLSFSSLGIIWFAAFLAPSLVSYNLPQNMVFFEHRLYLPLVGMIIFFATALRNIDMSKYRYIPLVGIIILFSVLTFNYSGAYANKIVFWQKAVAGSPNSADAHNGLATAYLTDNKFQEAEAEFIKTLELNSNERRVHLLLGLYYFDQQEYEKAKAELEKELEIDPNQFLAYHALGRIYIQRKNFKEAEKFLLKTVEINPDYVLAHQDLAVLYFSQNKHSQTVAHLKELLKRQTAESLEPHIRQILEIYGKEIAEKQLQ